MSFPEIARDLQAQICESVYVEADENGRHYIATPFVFGDGDQPVIALIPHDSGWMLSDLGNTMFRLGFQLDSDAMLTPDTQLRLHSALSMAGISRRDDELTKPLQHGNYAEALFDFIHALLKIDELGDFAAATYNPHNSALRNDMPAKTAEVFEYVKKCASEKHTVTYGEVGDAVFLMPFDMDAQLDYIRDEICSPRGLPCLSAIVVRKDTRIPGKGFSLDGMTIDADGFRPRWDYEVQRVFATDWKAIKLENKS